MRLRLLLLFVFALLFPSTDASLTVPPEQEKYIWMTVCSLSLFFIVLAIIGIFIMASALKHELKERDRIAKMKEDWTKTRREMCAKSTVKSAVNTATIPSEPDSGIAKDSKATEKAGKLGSKEPPTDVEDESAGLPEDEPFVPLTHTLMQACHLDPELINRFLIYVGFNEEQLDVLFWQQNGNPEPDQFTFMRVCAQSKEIRSDMRKRGIWPLKRSTINEFLKEDAQKHGKKTKKSATFRKSSTSVEAMKSKTKNSKKRRKERKSLVPDSGSGLNVFVPSERSRRGSRSLD